MKCPKCGYLGFESADRCRNCGFDFSLADAGGGRAGRAMPPPGAVDGLTPQGEAGGVRRTRNRRDESSAGLGIDRPLAGQPEGMPVDLPLFGGAGQIPLPPTPRPPLAVRRSTPTPARIRPRPVLQADALPLDLEEPVEPTGGGPPAEPGGPGAAASPAATAPPGRRVTAAAIDLGLLLLVDIVVLHFTLAVCGLTLNDVRVVPVLPMAVFLAILNGGYIVLFTGTLGQTLGKMAASIEVVTDRHDAVDLSRATVRSAAMVLSLLTAGLGWLVAFAGDGRSLHDRLAGTRVARVAGS